MAWMKKVILKNDVEVQCMGLPLLSKNDCKILQKGLRKVGPKALLSVGTGLGAGYMIQGNAFATEFGQTLVSEKKVLEKTLTHLPAKKDYKDQKSNKSTEKSCHQFYQNLATVAMNFALALKPTEGIYLYGKMLDEQLISQTKFTQQFISHPTMRNFLKTVPIFLIKKENLAFLGFKELMKKYDLS